MGQVGEFLLAVWETWVELGLVPVACPVLIVAGIWKVD